MLNDRDRHLLKDLERQLQQERTQPGYASSRTPSHLAGHSGDLLPVTVIGLLVLLTALGLLLDIPVAAAIFGSAAIVLAHKRYRL